MKIKDLPPDSDLGGVKFCTPDGVEGYWYSRWGYMDGKSGIWYKTDMQSSQIFPLTLNTLDEALEFEVVE